MTDHDAALRFDAMLDRLDPSDPSSSDSLSNTARTIQQLDNRQRGMPSDAFRTQLRQTLFVSTSDVPRVSMNGSSAAPLPLMPAKKRQSRSATSHRLLAVAAALVLLIGGAGWAVLGPFGSRSDREPDAIPAASFATPASPEPSSEVAWIAPAPDDAYVQASPQAEYADGRILRSIPLRSGSETLQAVDSSDGSVLWEVPSPVRVNAMQVHDDLLLVAGMAGEFPEYDYVLMALDAGTGAEMWRAPLSQLPVDIVVVGDRALVLSNDNNLDAIDLDTHQVDYVADIGGRSLMLDRIPNKAFSSNDRMAVIDQTLAVVLADGSIGGYDVETGMGQWWLINTVPSRARVYAIDGTFVVLVDGRWEEIVATPAGGAATPVPEASPGPASCRDSVNVFTDDAMAEGDAPANWQRLFYGLDPETGTPRWAGSSTGALTLDAASEQGLDLVVIPPDAWANGSAQVAICTVDGGTGDVTQVDRLTDLADRTVRLLFADEGDVDLVVGMLENDRFLVIPAILMPDGTEPTIDFGNRISPGGSAWIDVFDGDIYLSLQDGRLVKVAIPID